MAARPLKQKLERTFRPRSTDRVGTTGRPASEPAKDTEGSLPWLAPAALDQFARVPEIHGGPNALKAAPKRERRPRS
jgi:hypothetical protein